MSSKFKPWLVLAVIFVAGILTGIALTIGVGPHFMHPPGGAPQIKRVWMAQLVMQLKLTPDQQAKIQPILTDAESKLQSVHHDEMERGAQIFKAAHDQIAALLTPEQQVELQKMESDREKKFSEHMRPWGPPHDGPTGMHHHDGAKNEAPAPPPPPPPPFASTNAAPPGAPPGP